MNVYELEKLVKQGLWELAYDSTGYHMEANGYPVIDGSSTSDELTTRFAVHCCNNYMKVLAALKACTEQMGHTLPYSFAPDGMDALIAELEEVK